MTVLSFPPDVRNARVWSALAVLAKKQLQTPHETLTPSQFCDLVGNGTALDVNWPYLSFCGKVMNTLLSNNILATQQYGRYLVLQSPFDAYFFPREFMSTVYPQLGETDRDSLRALLAAHPEVSSDITYVLI